MVKEKASKPKRTKMTIEESKKHKEARKKFNLGNKKARSKVLRAARQGSSTVRLRAYVESLESLAQKYGITTSYANFLLVTGTGSAEKTLQLDFKDMDAIIQEELIAGKG